MRLSTVLLLLLITAAALPATAQITFTQSDAVSFLTRTATVSNFDATTLTGAQALADKVGPAQTWDFTVLTYGAPEVTQTSPATPPVPGSSDPRLATATHVQRSARADSVAYSFYRISASSLDVLGVSSNFSFDGTDTTVVVAFDPHQQVFPLPLTASSSWTNTYQFDTGIEGFTTEIRESATVEGWGTLVTPAGQSAALKVREKMVTTSTFAIPGQPPFVSRDSFYVVNFVTKTGLSAFLFLDASGSVEDAAYSSFQTGTAAEPTETVSDAVRLIVAGANPAQRGASVNLRFELDRPGAATIEAFDLLGRRVSVVAQGRYGAGTHEATWRTADLPAGLYLLRLSAGGVTQTRGIVLAD